MNNLKIKLAICFLSAVLFFPIVTVQADDTVPPPDVVVTPTEPDNSSTPDQIPVPATTILIRNGSTIIYQGVVALPVANTVDIPDSAGIVHTINAKSVLGFLYSVAQTSGTFSISDIEYYSSFDSLYVKCITDSGNSALCDNWQYIVNGTIPLVGMDSMVLSGGETLGIYFGFPHQILFDMTTISAGGSFTATAQKYDYINDSWSPLAGVTIGATVPNPNDPYSPTVVVTQTTATDGTATILLADTGAYTIGIVEDYYFPSYVIQVTAPIAAHGESARPSNEKIPSLHVFDVPAAIAYLMRVQDIDGSFGGNDMYTDWASIAFSAIDTQDDHKAKILEYLSLHNSVSPLLTDNERRAMALLALGQNPYVFGGKDLVAPIIRAFDGTQFGDNSIVNDDIFALIPLASSGYTSDDQIIQKDIRFILSKQRPDGSWEESTDLTSAGIQALASFSENTGVPAALALASTYLRAAQLDDGGWSSVFSTSWTLQASALLLVPWEKNNKDGNDYLATMQALDGGALPNSDTLQNRIWATSYAIPAVLGKSWNAILHPVPRPTQAPEVILSDIPSDRNDAPVHVASEKRSEVITPVPVASSINAQEIPVTPSLDQDMSSTLVATAGKSGTKVPVTVAVIISALVFGIVIFRSARRHN